MMIILGDQSGGDGPELNPSAQRAQREELGLKSITE